MSTTRFCPASAAWRKSSYSTAHDTCVEIADQFSGVVPIRDSKASGGPVLTVGAPAWAAFVAAVNTEALTGRAGAVPSAPWVLST
ncbi:DUF397 domain-containing protein [Streptomyces sp. I05A-00742]|uniref:DUF397 domain-containing protein n=1 Tax=Streptomyces sp. I05A-00742 TaxID=2732853 RepID=UPI00289E1977|nr:DUF397 domain-containing protein [Streptomyces sp. I05A-00742]